MLDILKEIINYLHNPTVAFTLLTVGFPFVFPPTDWFDKKHRQLHLDKLWTNRGGFMMLLILIGYFILGFTDKNAVHIFTKPDNVPIIIMMFTVVFFLWLSMNQAYRNDERLDRGEKPDEYNDPNDKILVWPDLVYSELISLILMTVFLILWSVFIKAPLEEPANPAMTPNPSKAPWYFLGLQEMLVYFDPWIAGILFPILIIVGLSAIPYMDINLKSSGFYSFKSRRTAIFAFLYGWLVLWIFLIIVGTILRGPNWNFFGPYEYWDPHKVEALTNINLSEYVWVKAWNQGLPSNPIKREFLGFILVIFYFVVPPFLLAKTKLKDVFNQLGPVRYSFLMFFTLSMLSLPIKMYLRWIFNLKYLVSIPEWFFNI